MISGTAKGTISKFLLCGVYSLKVGEGYTEVVGVPTVLGRTLKSFAHDCNRSFCFLSEIRSSTVVVVEIAVTRSLRLLSRRHVREHGLERLFTEMLSERRNSVLAVVVVDLRRVPLCLEVLGAIAVVVTTVGLALTAELLVIHLRRLGWRWGCRWISPLDIFLDLLVLLEKFQYCFLIILDLVR